MIIDSGKIALPNDPTPTDAPPSYDTLVSLDPSRLQLSRDSKAPTSPSYSGYSGGQLRSPSAIAGPSSPPMTCPSSAKGKGKINWFNFAAYRTEQDVRKTVLGLVRDLVREHHSDSAAPLGILQSCAAACDSQSLSLSSLLQEKSIEGHTPLYWAIVKRKPDEDVEDTSQIPDLLIALLSHSTPLKKDTIMDIRHACLITSDQRLFQRLRMSPEFATVSGSDQMLLGVTLPHDEIEVEELPGDEGEFAVNFVIPHFQKRMMVTQEIPLEFIARSRMWKLVFAIAGQNGPFGPRLGSWTISLSLQDSSPPTWIDSRLVVVDPAIDEHPPPISPSPGSASRSESFLQSASNTFGFNPPSPRSKARPPISIRLPCRERLQSKGFQIVISLEDSPSAATLQYAGNPYIAADEKLRVRLEASLRMPEHDCIIS
ncbi:hypothetical protein DFP72DRAFT_905204 [Ephemerocybe angulata]|uniref:Uncharacterized protein n=1 Tax=Ephemerocybe angulata TaxID=980116 RepID=A0A8H6M1N8_9AGAR|nr:hypothetical protein DFP72DRAFT_905204 [Tulosesus angulatus]